MESTGGTPSRGRGRGRGSGGGSRGRRATQTRLSGRATPGRAGATPGRATPAHDSATPARGRASRGRVSSIRMQPEEIATVQASLHRLRRSNQVSSNSCVQFHHLWETSALKNKTQNMIACSFYIA